METLIQKTACFSGYRPEKFSFILEEGEEGYLALRKRTAQAIIQAVNDGYTRFMCGMADGFDLVAGSVFLELREKRPDMAGIQLIAVLPFAGHGFSSPWQVVHQLVLGRADEVVTLASKYHPQAYHDRNRYMVDHSSRLICYCDGKKGGTDYTVKLAEQQGLAIVCKSACTFDPVSAPDLTHEVMRCRYRGRREEACKKRRRGF